MGKIQIQIENEIQTAATLNRVVWWVVRMRTCNWMSVYSVDYEIWHDRINGLLDVWEEQHDQAQIQTKAPEGEGQVPTTG